MSSCKGENGEMNSLYKDTFPIQRICIWNPSFYCSLWLGWRKFEDFEINQQPQKNFRLKKKQTFFNRNSGSCQSNSAQFNQRKKKKSKSDFLHLKELFDRNTWNKINIKNLRQVWWHEPLIIALRRKRWGPLSEFQASLIYRVSYGKEGLQSKALPLKGGGGYLITKYCLRFWNPSNKIW